jgi:hypothetical protein
VWPLITALRAQNLRHCPARTDEIREVKEKQYNVKFPYTSVELAERFPGQQGIFRDYVYLKMFSGLALVLGIKI